MTARRSALLLSLPAALAGCLAAHFAAYALAAPDPDRSHMLAETGHGYLAHLPALAAVLGAVALLAAARAAVLAARRDCRLHPSPRLFAFLPPLAFAVQEHVERVLASGTWPAAAVLEPTFALGLLLQAPFALLAWVLARTVLDAAEYLGRRVAGSAPRSRPRSLPLPALVSAPARSAVGAAVFARGPPSSPAFPS